MAYFWLILFLTHCLIYCRVDLNPIDPECSTPGKQGKHCCAGYRPNGKKCYACIGSIGFNCVKPCPVGYYGIQCLEKCQCDNCNTKTGECSNETTTAELYQENEGNRSSILIPILLGLFASVGSIAGVLFSIYAKERKKTTRNDVLQLDQNTDANDDAEDYDAIRYSCMMLEDDSACNKQKNALPLDRISYAKTQAIPNTYNKLSFNKSQRHSMDFGPQELYNTADHFSSHMQCQPNHGEYVSIAAANTTSCSPGMTNYTVDDEHCQTVDNEYLYDDVLNVLSEKTVESSKTNYVELPLRGRDRRKKPILKPKPVTSNSQAVNPDSSSGKRPYSLANH